MAQHVDIKGSQEQREGMAQRLVQLRTVLNENASAVARLVGVNQPTWNRYEKGGRDIDPVVLAEFCRIFGVSADWVILGDLYSLPKEVIVRLLQAYPQIADAAEPQRALSNTRR